MLHEILRQKHLIKSRFDVLSIKNPPPKYKIIPTVLNHYYQVCIYGAGVYGIRNYLLLKESGVKISFFCDRDSEKHGIILDGVTCISLEELEAREKKNIVIFICIKDGNTLKEEFQKAGFPYVYTSETISDLIGADFLNPYQDKEKLDLNKGEMIDKINLFRNQLAHMTCSTVKADGFDNTDSFEKMLKDVLVNENTRKKH